MTLINKLDLDKQPHKPRIGFLKYGGIPADLSKLPRCTATAKHSGKRCRRIALKNKNVCQFHGGKGGGPRGKKNGNYKHGRNTQEAYRADKVAKAHQAFMLSAFLGKGSITDKQAELVLQKKKSYYEKKKPEGYIPVKQREYYCVFQKGGDIWGIGTCETTNATSAKDKAERDAEYNIDNEFMLYDSVTECPTGDYVVMKCSRGLYDKVNEKGGGIKYRITDGQTGLQVRINIPFKPGPKSKRYKRRPRSKYLPF